MDQLVKHIIRSVGGFYICNPHASWGIAISSSLFWILWAAIITLLLFFFLKKPHNRWHYTGLTLVLAGALSNSVDRVLLGCVMDFISIGFWPVFNLADIFISIGAIMVVKEIILTPK